MSIYGLLKEQTKAVSVERRDRPAKRDNADGGCYGASQGTGRLGERGDRSIYVSESAGRVDTGRSFHHSCENTQKAPKNGLRDSIFGIVKLRKANSYELPYRCKLFFDLTCLIKLKITFCIDENVIIEIKSRRKDNIAEQYQVI